MPSKDLLNLTNDENEKSQDLIKSILAKEKKRNISALFPEYDFDGFYGLHKAYEPLAKSLIYFDKVIVKLHPEPTKKKFKEKYGVSIKQMKRLVARGKVNLLIGYPFESFDDNYLPLLKMSPVRTSRTRDYLKEKTNIDQERIEFAVENALKDAKFADYAKRRFANLPLTAFQMSFSSDLYDLKLLQLDEIVEIILNIIEVSPQEAHMLTARYSDFITKPMFEALGGATFCSPDDLKMSRWLNLKTESFALGSRKNFAPDTIHRLEQVINIDPANLTPFLPADIALSNFQKIEDIDMFVDNIEKDNDIKELRQLIHQVGLGGPSFFNKDFKLISQEVSKKLERDAKNILCASNIIRESINIGFAFGLARFAKGATVSISDEVMFVVGHELGRNVKYIDKMSDWIFSKLTDPLIKSPLLSNYIKYKKQ